MAFAFSRAPALAGLPEPALLVDGRPWHRSDSSQSSFLFLAIKAQSALPAVSKEKPRPLRSIDAIIEDLNKPIAERHLRQRKQGQTTITYLPWHFAMQYLDHFAGAWSFEICNVAAIRDRCVVTARVTILCLEGAVWCEATGTEDEEAE